MACKEPHMTHRTLNRSILAAAVAATLGLSTLASAQYRVNPGHTNDANNRVGSGGNNPYDSDQRVGNQVSGNDIVTGNVTGGKQFRGQVPYTDPRAFRGQTSD